MKKVFTSAVAMVIAAPAFASNFNLDPVAVPEITALEGTAAVAMVAAVVAIVWERRKT